MHSSLTISGIQTDLSWENKKANLDMLGKKIESIRGSTEIVLLPEMFTTGFSMNAPLLAETMEGETVQWMKKISAANKIVLGGSIIIREDHVGMPPNYFNRFIWMLPTGMPGWYDKRHLFAYGDENNHYAGGSKRLIASVKGWKLNLLICYDLRFPVWSRQHIINEQNKGFEYDVLVFVANWPEKRSVAWKTLLQARAIENQCYVIGINRVGDDGNGIHYSGDSMVIGPLGDIIYSAHDIEDVFTTTLDRSHLDEIRARFPFWKEADNFEIK